MRRPAAPVKPRIAKSANFPAPRSGWIRNQSLTAPNARGPDGSVINGAHTLENWFPTTTGIRMRAGSLTHARVGDGTKDITALFSYANGNNQSLFASTDDTIYDVTLATASADMLITGDGDFFVTDLGDSLVTGTGASPSVVSTLAGGDWSTIQFATSGGTFLRAVNGLDTPLVYDGATWGTAPAITVVDPTKLSFVWAFQNRLFFVEKNTLNAWYLPAASIGGAAVVFPLGGVFSLGGSLLYGASWSLGTGDQGGLSEQCVFVSTEGEVAVYHGTDPSSDFAKVGVYRIGKPRGPLAVMRAGSDLVIATDIGFIPLSQALQRDYAALAPAAVSFPIEEAWNEAVAERSGDFWHCEIWPTKQMVLVSLPTESGDTPQIFVANARTGAWGLYTGWDATCVKTFQDRGFFGSVDGRVIEMEVTGSDDGAPYVCISVPLFDLLKSPASLKTTLQARATIRSSRPMNVQLSSQHEYTLALPPPPDDAGVQSGNVWGSGIWGTSVWGVPPEKIAYREWKSTPGAGYAVSTAMQITSANLSPPDAEVVMVDMLYDVGDVGS